MRTHKQSPRVVPVTMPPGSVPDPTIADLDPTDPVQALDETQDFHVEPLDVNVMPGAERQDEIDAALEHASSDEDEDQDEDEDVAGDPPTADDRTAGAHDVGELYGGHLTPADDPERGTGPERAEYAAAEGGENWLETLETASAEGGPLPEREVDANDDTDHDAHHGSESGDRPVADKGSGGPAGL